MSKGLVLFETTRSLKRLAVLFLILGLMGSAAKAEKWVTVYYESWIKWSPGGMDVDSIDFTTGTHWIWFSSDIASDGTIEPTRAGGSPDRLKAFCDSAHAHGRKAILGTGGWGADYTPAASHPQTFGHSIAGFMRTAGFDGLDIDWEPVPTAQRTAYITMCRIVKDSIRSVNPNGLLTAACFGFDQAQVDARQHLDQINLMTYDIAGSWTRMTWHNNPVYDRDYLTPDNVTPGSIDKSINSYIGAGVPASQLGMGIDLYTYVWMASDTLASTSFGQVSSNVLYGAVMNTYYKKGKPIYWDSKAKASFFVHPFVSFDSDTAMLSMAEYANSKGLGGAIVFAYFGGSWNEDPRGERQNGKRQPNLMRAIKYAFGLGGSMPARYPFVPPAPPPPKTSTWIYYDSVNVNEPWMPWGYAASVNDANRSPLHSGNYSWRCDFQPWSKEGWMHQVTWNQDTEVYSDSLVFWAYPLSAFTLELEFEGYPVTTKTFATPNQWQRCAIPVPGPFVTFTFNNNTGNSYSLVLDEIALVRNDPVTGIPQPPPPPGQQPPPPPVVKKASVIFDDALRAPWSDVSSAATRHFDESTRVKTGTRSIRVDYLPWGELSLLSGPTWGQETPWAADSLKFDIYPTTQVSIVTVFYGSVDTYSANYPANQWTSVTVPCPSSSGYPVSFTRFRITNNTSNSPTCYFDNVQLVVNGTPPAKTTSHNVGLQQGWNMISSYVQPFDSTLSQLCSDVLQSLVLLKNGAGQVYWPEYGINTIGNWNAYSGYQTYMQSSDMLTLTGNQLSPETVPMPLVKGYNLVAYLRNSPMRIDSALASINDTGLVVKNNAGQVYWPAYAINNIGSMIPGQGYQLYTSRARTLTYPANGPGGTNESPGKVTTPTRFLLSFQNTGANALLLVQSAHLADGDEIAVWSSRATLVGSSVASSGRALVTIWGVDPVHPSVGGAKDGEDLHLTVWSAARQVEGSLPIESLHDFFSGETKQGARLQYRTDAVLIASVRSFNDIPSDFDLSQNYPNPFNPTTVIGFQIPVAARTTLKVFDLLGREVRTLVNDLHAPGSYQVQFDGTGLASGMYIYRLEAGTIVLNKRLMLLK